MSATISPALHKKGRLADGNAKHASHRSALGSKRSILTEQELQNLNIVLGAYRTLRGDRRRHIGYVSMPITTGKLLYDKLIEGGVKSADEFKQKFGKETFFNEIVKKNIENGVNFADGQAKRENLLLIAPSVFNATPWKWSQDAYMVFWYRVILELAGKHMLMPGWEYSTGGIQEVLFTLLMQWGIINPGENIADAFSDGFTLKNYVAKERNDEEKKEWEEYEEMQKIKIVDAKSSEIRIDTALEMIMNAISRLHTTGLDDLKQKNGPCANLIRLAQKIALVAEKRNTRDMYLNYESKGAGQILPIPYDAHTDLFWDSVAELEKLSQTPLEGLHRR